MQNRYALMSNNDKFSFSGHETFPCKTLWLIKGYDFISSRNNFASAESVVELGVGKNMVSSIRYWMKAFGLLKNDKLTDVSHFLLNEFDGRDRYLEDLGTLWLLHYLLVITGEATLYNWCFIELQRERLSFERSHMESFVKRKFAECGREQFYNEATIRKDIGVLLLNYANPFRAKSVEEYQNLLLDLQLVRTEDGKTYAFNLEHHSQVPYGILLFALVHAQTESKSLDFSQLQRIAAIFCFSDVAFLEQLQILEQTYPDLLNFTDTSGIRQVQFLRTVDPLDALRTHYDNVKL